jgi:phosphate transport system substrate-binding protein
MTLIKRTAIIAAAGICLIAASATAETRLQGAGSTFVNPMMQRWTTEYQKTHPEVKIDYQSIGSGGGIKGFTDKTIDFGASDAQLTKKDIAAAGGNENIVEFPIIAGGVVPAYNLPGVTEVVKFTGPVLADIYMGNITKWNDPKLTAINPGVALPDLAIAPAYRTDGSGTTFIWSSYLATQSDDFKDKIGAAKQVKWPTGNGGKGNEGVTAAVQQTPGGIGYVEQGYADHNNIAYGAVQNKNGQFIKCSPQSVSKAGEDAAGKLSGTMLVVDLWNQPGDGVYPISGVTYIFLYKDLNNVKSPQQAQALVDFMWWATHDGQTMATEMDYAPLNDTMQKKVEGAMADVKYSGNSIKPMASR